MMMSVVDTRNMWSELAEKYVDCFVLHLVGQLLIFILHKQIVYKRCYRHVDTFKFALVSADRTMNFVVIRKGLSKKRRANQAFCVSSMHFVQSMITDSSETLLCVVFNT